MVLFHTTVLDNQIKALPTLDTASGSIATFDTDMTENLVKCVCEVASGASEINVSACGKNLLDKDNANVINDYIDRVNLKYIANSSHRLVYIPIKPNATYTVSKSSVSSRFAIAVSPDIPVNNGNVSDAIQNNNATELTITAGASDRYLAVWFWFTQDTLTPEQILDSLQIELGSTATTYEPFNGTTYNIPFGETLSGDGTFDVLSGILTRSDDTTKQLSANYIQTINGINNIWCNTGDTEVKYLLTVGKKIA